MSLRRSHAYTCKEVGLMLGLGSRTIRRYLADGTINGFRLPNGTVRIYHDDLVDFMKKWDIPIPRSIQGDLT